MAGMGYYEGRVLENNSASKDFTEDLFRSSSENHTIPGSSVFDQLAFLCPSPSIDAIHNNNTPLGVAVELAIKGSNGSIVAK